MGKLTAKAVLNAKTENKDTAYSDGDGLSLRVRVNGIKSWIFRYRRPADKKQDKITLGNYPDISLKEARAVVQNYRGQLEKGIDPKQAKAAAFVENSTALTMGTVFKTWIEHISLTGDITARSIKQHQDRWDRHLKAHLSNILVRDITRAHLASALDAMRNKGIREETRKALTTLGLTLDYAVSRHYAESNQARLLKPKDFGTSANKPKERALSLVELRELWAGVDMASSKKEGVASTARLSPLTSTAIKLLVLTGSRRLEVIGMRWAELDLKQGEWTLPPERTKNRKTHTVYLSPLAVQLIKTLAPLTGSSPFVFQSERKRDNHVHQDSLTTAIQRLCGSYKSDGDKEKNKKAPLENMTPFTIHDLRRSAATAWGEHLKVQPHVIERMLNHQPENKLVAVYQKALYLDEQKAAWLAWGEKVEGVIAQDPDNVIQITSKQLNK